MTHTCPHCGAELNSWISRDELWWHTSRPKCTGSFDVDVSQAVEAFQDVLIGFLIENRKSMKALSQQEIRNNNYWKQAKALFTSIAIFKGDSPDTHSGDNLIFELYEKSNPEISFEDFDLFMWSDLV